MGHNGRAYPRQDRGFQAQGAVDGWGCCQTNANQSQFSSSLNLLGCAEAAPLGQSRGTVVLKI
jgi:hypothetical protein